MTTLQAAVHSPELERAVLGVLLDGRHQSMWSTFLDTCRGPSAFFIRDHRIVCLAMMALSDAGQPINAQSVVTRLGQMPFERTMLALRAIESGQAPRVTETIADLSESALAAIEGPERVFQLQGSFAPASGFTENCRLLAAYANQRAMIRVLLEATEHANAVDGATKLPAIADQAITRLASLVIAQEGTATISEAMRRAITKPRPSTTEAPAVASWGLTALDRALPLRPCRYVVLAAQPGHGKSSLALQAATATADALGDGAVALVNLEMPAEQIGAILLGRDTGTPVKAIENGTMLPEQVAAAEERITTRAGADIYLRTATRKVSIEEISGWIRQRQVRSAGRLSMVVLDYLQLVGSSGKHRQTEYDRISEASQSLKLLANELRLTLLVLSQLTREGSKADRDAHGRAKGNPEPRLQDLRGSGSIEQDADAVVFIWPPHETEEADLPCRLKIAKNRGGPKWSIDAVFERARGQVFRQVSAPAALMREESSRAHHNHPPSPAEDGWASRSLEEPA